MGLLQLPQQKIECITQEIIDTGVWIWPKPTPLSEEKRDFYNQPKKCIQEFMKLYIVALVYTSPLWKQHHKVKGAVIKTNKNSITWKQETVTQKEGYNSI